MSVCIAPCVRFAAICVVFALFFATADVAAQGLPSYRVVENLTQTFRANRDFTAIAFAPSDPQRIYIGTSDGWIYSSRDGGMTWGETRLLYSLNFLPRRTAHRHGFTVWPHYILALRHADLVGWPQAHFLVNSWRVHHVFTPHKFEVETLNPNPALTGGAPAQLGEFARRNPHNWTESHFHEVFVGMGSAHGGMWYDFNEGNGRRLAYAVGALRHSVRINWITVHPEDPDYVLAATDDGLFRSEDGGGGWVREYDHIQPERRWINHAAFDPTDADKRYLCTNYGVLKSSDGGTTYDRVRDPILSRKQCFFVTTFPGRPDELWVGTDYGTWVSDNGGDHFVHRHVEQAPGRQAIKRYAFDPTDSDRVLAMADEVVFLSRDEGRSFERLGMNDFKAQWLNSAMFGSEPGHLIVATNRDVWESFDDGRTWQVIMFGNINWKIRRIAYPNGPSGDLWVLTGYELLKLVDREPYEMNARQSARLRDVLENEPTLTQTVYEALRVHGALRPQIQKIRDRARWQNIAPTLHFDVTYRHFEVDFDIFSLAFGLPSDGERFPRGLAVTGGLSDLHFNLWANWNLENLVANPQEMPMGPLYEENERLARDLRTTVTSLYTERRRLQIQAVTTDYPDVRSVALRDVRIEELTNHINLLTENLFERYREGERIEAWQD